MKKILLALIIFTLVFTLFAGCTQQKVNSEEPQNDTSENNISYPEKPITLVVPWGAGGVTDTTARVFAPLLEKNLGKPVTIVNQPGASGSIGTDFAYSKDADGYTILFSAETPALFKVMGLSDLGFDNFDPIMMVIDDPKVIVVPKNSKYETFEDLVQDIKERPGKVKQSYSGPGASGHIQGLIFKNVGLDISMTPFGGGNDAMIAAISGGVDFTFANYGTVVDYLKTGELRALAVYSNTENSALPGIPALSQVVPETAPYLPLAFPNCLLVKEGTPVEIQEIILEAAKKAVQEPEWIQFVEVKNYNRMDELEGEEVTKYWDKFTSIVSWLLYDAGAAKNNPGDLEIKKYEQ